MMGYRIFYGVLFLLLLCCKQYGSDKNPQQYELQEHYTEKFRPQFHFSPLKNWMNDPNGLVYHDGLYHLFYQYYPGETVWGPMHWGHAVSKDLAHWQQKPIALYPDEHGFIFSGSAVVDYNNTSGFGRVGQTPLVAVFTYHDLAGEKAGRIDFQTQGIAYSLDNGDTWAKYEGNPVIQNDTFRDFRDPKVFWHKASKSWVMVLVAGNHAKFYRSPNLKDWSFMSDFGMGQGAHGGVWECPDLFPLKVEGSDKEKWVLIISIGNGAPNGGSGTQYFVGDFDGTEFTTEQKDHQWLDWGTDNYAGVTYNSTPYGERIFIGWMSNWQYATVTPTHPWRSAMTVARKLSLQKFNDTYMVKSNAVKSIFDLAGNGIQKEALNISENNVESIDFSDLNQSLTSFTTSGRNFTLSFSNEDQERLQVLFDERSELVMLNRTQSGTTDFQQEFGNKLQYMNIAQLPEGEIDIKIFMDASSVEVFINNGQYVMTAQLFPKTPYQKLTIKNSSNNILDIKDLKIKKMKSIW